VRSPTTPPPPDKAFLEIPALLPNTSSELEEDSPRPATAAPRPPPTFDVVADLAFKAAANAAALDGCKHDEEPLGLGEGDTPGDVLGEAPGDTLGDEPVEEEFEGVRELLGDRLGEGSGNSSFSSSSAIGEAFRFGGWS